jgi:putative transposase
MNTPSTDRYKNHRFPAEIISHGVGLYFRFCLSYRDVEELLFARGIIVTYEAIRKWCRKFGQQYAHQLRRRRPKPGDKWHLDEVFLTINGERHYLWRAVDQDGHGLDILVQPRRDRKAAKRFFRKLLKRCQYLPRVLITDQLKSYGAAKREVLPSVEHRQHRYLNNRPENSHQPTRQRERRMQGFKSPGHAQRVPRCLWAHCPTFPPATPPPLRPGLSRRDDPTLPELARSDRASGCIDSATDRDSPPSRPMSRSTGNKLTKPLRGYNLACSCTQDVPCHAALLLQLANGDR